MKLLLIISLACGIHGYGSGKLPKSVCENLQPGPPHGENEVSDKDNIDPPFLMSASKAPKGDFFLGKFFTASSNNLKRILGMGTSDFNYITLLVIPQECVDCRDLLNLCWGSFTINID